MESTETLDPLKRYHNEDWHTPHGHLIREVIFGGTDGLVTMIGFVAGATGALLTTRPIILASEALLVAGSLSMAIGAYLSSKAQREFFENQIAREELEIRTMPERETQEVRDHYRELGFSPDQAEMITKHIVSNPKLWIRFMMKEELGLVEKFDNPLVNAGIIGAAFFVTGWVPVLPYFFTGHIPTALLSAAALSVAALFGMGVAKARITNTSWMKSAMEVAWLGSAAMVIGYVASRFASSILPQ